LVTSAEIITILSRIPPILAGHVGRSQNLLKITPQDDEKLTMALRPVSDSAKHDSAGSGKPGELDAVAKLIANDSQPETSPADPPVTMIEPTGQAEQAPKHTVAGWYPDDSDPTLLRYWDGHHLTGQTMRVDPATADEEEPTEPALSPQGDTAERSTRTNEIWTELQSNGDSNPATVGDTAHDETAAQEAVSVAAVTADGHTPVDMADQWAERTAQTVARARTTSTPEAWREVVSVAAVVSELAQTMMVAASAAQVSKEASRVAEKARSDAEAADEAAAAARQASQQATTKAQEAQDAAKTAARAASDAMQAAQQAEQEAPEAAEAAETAAREAANAKATFEELEGIVAGAQAADTPEAWTEAHRLAAGAFTS
jgi:hypothetical protein